MKILDSFIKTMTPVQNTGAPLKNEISADKKIQETPVISSESSRIIADLKSQGYEISSNDADRISEFIDKTEGAESEKLQTVKTALEKGLPLSARSLQSIQAALFEPVLSDDLQRLLAGNGSDVSAERVDLLRAFAKMAVQKESGTAASPGQAAADLILGTDQPASRDDKVIEWLLKALDQVAGLSNSLEFMDEAVKSEKNQPEYDVPATAVEQTDRESFIREAVDQFIQSEEVDVPVEALAQGISLLMKEITPRMAAVKTEFETLRKAVTAELTAVRSELDKPVGSNKTNVVEKLGQAIDRLDNAILKSDIPLYTSMKAEKQLLTWSSELQEARSLASNGQSAEASEIVDRISKGVQEIQFQPAKLKVIHRALQQNPSENQFNEKGLHQRALQQINRILEPVHTSREVLEAFKAMGLTHESEVVSTLGQSSKKLKEDWLPKESLKEILMKLASDTQEKLTTVTGAEKALNNLTGQQLLSRPEAKPQGQTLVFSVPMEMASRVEDLKIYVQSRKDKGKVDWENCTFYFAVHTEKFGDMGIRFAAARKSVSIQVKCDNQGLRDAVGPLVEDFKKAMWEAGYKIAGISYSPLKDTISTVPGTEEPVAAESDGKGLNVTV